MSILMKSSRQTKVRKTKIFFHIGIDLFLILVILLITGFSPQINNAFPVDSQPTQTSSSTQVVGLTDSSTPNPSLTATPTSTPFMLLASTQVSASSLRRTF